MVNKLFKKLNLHYTRGITSEAFIEWRGSSARLSAWAAQLREEATQRWRTVGDTLSDLTGPGIKPRTSRAESDVFKHYANWPMLALFVRDILL